MALTYPLDQIRTLAQAGDSDTMALIEKIFTDPQSLYRGCVSVIETVAVSNFIYFYLLEYSKRNFKSPLLASTIAGVLNILITEPLWKASTAIKMSSSDSRSLPAVLVRMAKKDGVSSLWSGTRVSLYLVSNPIIQFTTYEWLKKGKQVTPFQAFLLGAISKSIATISTYPLQVAQTRLRLPSAKNSSILQILSDLYTRDGLHGLFRGCNAKLYQTVLTAAFMFAFYERIVALIATRKRRLV